MLSRVFVGDFWRKSYKYFWRIYEVEFLIPRYVEKWNLKLSMAREIWTRKIYIALELY